MLILKKFSSIFIDFMKEIYGGPYSTILEVQTLFILIINHFLRHWLQWVHVSSITGIMDANFYKDQMGDTNDNELAITSREQWLVLWTHLKEWLLLWSNPLFYIWEWVPNIYRYPNLSKKQKTKNQEIQIS